MPVRRTLSPTILAHALLLAVVMVWGTTFTLVKAALEDAPPLVFNLLRMTIAFAVLAGINWKAIRTAPARDVKNACAAGVFLGLGYQFQTAGLAHTTPSKSAFITGMVVVFVPLLCFIPALRPREIRSPAPIALIGAVIAFAGLILLTTPAGSARNLFAGFGAGELLSLACAVAFAGHLMMLAHATPQTNARVLGTLQIGTAAALMLITLPLGGRPQLHVTPRLLGALLVTAVLATAVAFTVQSWAQQHLSPTHTALILTLEPVFAWLTSLVFFHEHLGPRELTGAALILTGILAAELLPNAQDAPVASNGRDS